MAIEVESKFRVHALSELQAKIAALGAIHGATKVIEDIYLSHPVRDFATTREALRIRAVNGIGQITYKCPVIQLSKSPHPDALVNFAAKSRTEIECDLAPGKEATEGALRVFLGLGFCIIASLHKSRQSFVLRTAEGTLSIDCDVVTGLGSYVEIEQIVATAGEVAAAKARLQKLATQLGLIAPEPRSYLEMALAANSKA